VFAISWLVSCRTARGKTSRTRVSSFTVASRVIAIENAIVPRSFHIEDDVRSQQRHAVAKKKKKQQQQQQQQQQRHSTKSKSAPAE